MRHEIPHSIEVGHPLRPLDEHEAARLGDLSRPLIRASFTEPENPRDATGAMDAVDHIIHTVDAHPGGVILARTSPLTIACDPHQIFFVTVLS